MICAKNYRWNYAKRWRFLICRCVLVWSLYAVVTWTTVWHGQLLVFAMFNVVVRAFYPVKRVVDACASWFSCLRVLLSPLLHPARFAHDGKMPFSPFCWLVRVITFLHLLGERANVVTFLTVVNRHCHRYLRFCFLFWSSTVSIRHRRIVG